MYPQLFFWHWRLTYPANSPVIKVTSFFVFFPAHFGQHIFIPPLSFMHNTILKRGCAKACVFKLLFCLFAPVSVVSGSNMRYPPLSSLIHCVKALLKFFYFLQQRFFAISHINFI